MSVNTATSRPQLVGQDTGYYNVSVSSPPTPPSAIISFTAYPARRLDYGTCLAACFTALHAQSTVLTFPLTLEHQFWDFS